MLLQRADPVVVRGGRRRADALERLQRPQLLGLLPLFDAQQQRQQHGGDQHGQQHAERQQQPGGGHAQQPVV